MSSLRGTGHNAASQLVITSSTQAVTVVVESGTTDPTINLNSFCTGGLALLPALTITSVNAYNINIIIPASTTITSNGSSWNCIMDAPTVTTITLPETSGAITTLSKAIEIGFGNIKLSSDKPVRISFPNDKGKKVGYTQNDSSFSEILSLCGGDTGAGLGADGECKVDVGSDLVVWTRHFTKFATYSSAPITTPTPTPTTTPATAHTSTSIQIPTSIPIRTSTSVTTRTPTPIVLTVPEATHTTTTTETGIKLFDITLTIESATLNKSSDLVARTQFTSFGTVPTAVVMVYRVEDASGKEVFYEKGEVTVQTEQLVTKAFTNLDVGSGKYTLFLTTTYGNSVTDEFRQSFEVQGAATVKKSPSSTWTSILVIVSVISGYITYRWIKRRKKMRT